MGAGAKKRVAVFGWYGHGNFGDDSFKESFPLLWPGAAFSFMDAVPEDVNEAYDAAMVGGGSFLDAGLPGIQRLKLPTAFVGIGAGKAVAAPMREALARAEVVVVRDSLSYDRLRLMPGMPLLIQAADLVFARTPESWAHARAAFDPAGPKIVSVLLSEHFVPRGESPEWVSSSWAWFCMELAQALDKMVREGWRVQFVPMSQTRAWDDRRAAAAVVSRMTRAVDAIWLWHGSKDIIQVIGQSQLVISKRLHGAIFAAAMGVPCLAVSGHDKMAGFAEDAGLLSVDYYGLASARLNHAIEGALAERCPADMPNPYIAEARKRWGVASAVVREKLSL